MDISKTLFVYIGIATVSKLYTMYKLWRSDHVIAYKDVIIAICYATFAVITQIDDINDWSVLGFLAAIGVSFIIAAFGLWVSEIIIRIRGMMNHDIDYPTFIDTSVRWTVIAVLCICALNLVHDGFMLSAMARIDLLLADIIGAGVALFCLEKARLQLRQNTIVTSTDTA